MLLLGPQILVAAIAIALVTAIGGLVTAAVPLSVIAGALIVMAIQTFDQWPLQLAKKALVVESGDLRRNVCFNLALIIVVTVLIIFTDLTTAMLAGLILELLHFLLKSGKALVRQAIKGSLLHSNVVRDQRASSLLSERGDAIEVVTLLGSPFLAIPTTWQTISKISHQRWGWFCWTSSASPTSTTRASWY
jgi:MFS superfamily sulfate permease-like transporter